MRDLEIGRQLRLWLFVIVLIAAGTCPINTPESPHSRPGAKAPIAMFGDDVAAPRSKAESSRPVLIRYLRMQVIFGVLSPLPLCLPRTLVGLSCDQSIG